ncbi:MAG TPA: hypothetical protein VMV92_19090 [Streptosporangiaceae bacterium]|nr:hypothetical protein [Streptosporangiaceae bacterium]
MHLVAIGGSDAGISAALRARELDSGAEVTVVVTDAYPDFSICGIPYYISGEVARGTAHRRPRPGPPRPRRAHRPRRRGPDEHRRHQDRPRTSRKHGKATR